MSIIIIVLLLLLVGPLDSVHAQNSSSSSNITTSRIATAANPFQASIAMGAATFATLLFRDPAVVLTASRALAIAAMARSCRGKERVDLPSDQSLIFPQQSLMPMLQLKTGDDHDYNSWRSHYRGAVLAGMFIIPFGAALCSLVGSLIYHSVQHYRRNRKPPPPAPKQAKDADLYGTGFKINKADRSGEAEQQAAAPLDAEDLELEQMLLDIDSLQATNVNQNNGDDDPNEDSNSKKKKNKSNKFVDDVWQTARIPTVIAAFLAIALENVACSCVLLLSLDAGGLPYNRPLDRGISAASLVVFAALVVAASIKVNMALKECDCVDSEIVRGDPPEPWKTNWSELVFGTRCWALSRETELNRRSDTPAAKMMKAHLRYVGPFHGCNLSRPTEGAALGRYSLAPWTLLVEMVFTVVMGFGRGFLMADKVKCLSAAIWIIVLVIFSTTWYAVLRPRISPLLMIVDIITFIILLLAAITWIANWRFSDDVAGFGAIVIALGSLVSGMVVYVSLKCYGVRSVPLVRPDDIDIDIDAELMELLGGQQSSDAAPDVFTKPAMESALLLGTHEVALLADTSGGLGLQSLVDNMPVENMDDPHFNDLYLQYRDLVADGAAKNAKEVREARQKMKERAAELASNCSAEMRQQLALQRMQQRAEMIAAGRDPDTGRTFESMCDPDKPFEFTDDPHCRRLVDEYKALVNKPLGGKQHTNDAKAQKRLDELSIEIERRQETLMRMTDEQRRKLARDEAERNANRFRQYLGNNPFDKGFTCSDDPDYKELQDEARQILRQDPRAAGNSARLGQLHDLMQSRAEDLRQMLPVNRQMLADAARAERARLIAKRVDPDTGKSFDELCNPNRAFEYTDDAVYKTLDGEYKALSENPILNRGKMDALVRQMQLRSKVLDALSPEEKAALVKQTAARNAARLNQLFDWGGDPLGPSDVLLMSDDPALQKHLDQCKDYLSSDPGSHIQDLDMEQMEMRMRQDEIKSLSADDKKKLIDQRRANRLEMLRSGVDPFTGQRFCELVDDKRDFKLGDDQGYKALQDEYDFLSRDSPTAHESRLSELHRQMANKALALARLSDREKQERVRESAMRNGERIRRMMQAAFPNDSNKKSENNSKFLLTDDPEFHALQRQLIEMLASGKKGTAHDAALAALQDRLGKRASQLATLSDRERRAMAMLRQQNNQRMHEQHGRDPFTSYSYAQLADANRGFCMWDDSSFDALAREMKQLLDQDPAKHAARIADLTRRMQKRGIAMQGYSAAEKQQRTRRTANAFQDMMQRMLDGLDPLGPGHFVASTDDLVMRKAGEETHDLSRRGDLHNPGTAWHGDLLGALDTQRDRFPHANDKLTAAAKSSLVRARREEAARFAAAARDFRSGKTYEELCDARRAFQLTDDSVYEQLYEEMQHLVGENAPRHHARVQELEKVMKARALELEKLDEAAQRRLVESRALRNAQQFAQLPGRYDPLGAPHFTFTDDPQYKKLHDEMQQLLRRPMAGNYNEKLAALKKALTARAADLQSLDEAMKLKLTDGRRAQMLQFRKKGVDPLTGKSYDELCDPKRSSFQYTDDPEYRRNLESFLFFAGSNPDQHERRLADLAAALQRRQGVLEKWSPEQKRRAIEREIARLGETRKRNLNYGLDWTPPQQPLEFDLDDGVPELDLERDLAALVDSDPKPAAVVVNTDYQLDDDDDYILDDDENIMGDGDDPGSVGAARNEELMRRMMELKAAMDEKNAAAAAASGVYVGGGDDGDDDMMPY